MSTKELTLIDEMFNHMKKHIEDPALPKSGYLLGKIFHIEIDFHKLKLIGGSSYLLVPDVLTKQKAVINPKNDNDEECFRWFITTTLNYKKIRKNSEQITKLKPHDIYEWKGIEFPITINKIGKFEKNNPNISVNILSW